MAHGNKKFNFEELKEKGSEITVKTVNVQSLRNSLKRYCMENDIEFKKEVTHFIHPVGLGKFKVTRLT